MLEHLSQPLLEAILAHLPAQDLACAQRACSALRDAGHVCMQPLRTAWEHTIRVAVRNGLDGMRAVQHAAHYYTNVCLVPPGGELLQHMERVAVRQPGWYHEEGVDEDTWAIDGHVSTPCLSQWVLVYCSGDVKVTFVNEAHRLWVGYALTEEQGWTVSVSVDSGPEQTWMLRDAATPLAAAVAHSPAMRVATAEFHSYLLATSTVAEKAFQNLFPAP